MTSDIRTESHKEFGNSGTNLESKSGSGQATDSNSLDTIVLKTASAPVAQIEENDKTGILQKQISAPSYYHSLKANERPPFVKPAKEPKPVILIGTVFSVEDVIVIIGYSENDWPHGLNRALELILVEKKVVLSYDFIEKAFLVNFFRETIIYAAQHDFNAFKLSVLLTIYAKSHLFFKRYYWSSPVAIWHYFKEVMIRHTIEDSPDGQEVFEPEECYDIVTHFHTAYLTNLPLIHILTFGQNRVKLTWPYKTS